MIKKKFVGTFNVIIEFDDNLEYHAFERDAESMDEIVTRAEWLMDEWGFENAVIVDAESGEVLVEMKFVINE